MNYILDTNIITAHMKGDEKVKMKLEEAAIFGKKIFMSGISYYEIKRGLLAKNARRQLENFDELCKEIDTFLLNNKAIFDRASEIYADLRQRGKIIQDADILIASTALIYNLILVSNDSDFLRVEDIIAENWLKPNP
jgi:tRNA(fMet)-specific endonuclease VapC